MRLPFLRPLRALLPLLSLLAACGAQSISPSDVDSSVAFTDHVRLPDVRVLPDEGPLADRSVPRDVPQDTAPFATAPHAAFPQVVAGGGPTLAHVQLVVITFAGYDYASQVDALGRWLVQSDWLTTVGLDYGVGMGSFVQHVVLTAPPPIRTTDADARTIIAHGIATGTLPAVTPQTLYMIYYPRTTTIEGPMGVGFSCDAFGGYHDFATDPMPQFTYAVIPTCPDAEPGLDELQYLELASAHELIEAATDVDPLGTAGWQLTDTTNPWAFIGGEVADLCETESVMDSGYTIQRVWSNAAAALGNVDPCIPAVPGEVYYNVSASPDMVPNVMPGQTLTFTLTGFSSAPTTDWFIQAQPSGVGMFFPTPSLDRERINNGGTATLTVSIPADAQSGQYGGVLLISSHTAGAMDLSQAHLWPVYFFVE